MKTKLLTLTVILAALLGCKSAIQAQTFGPSCLVPKGLVAYWPLDAANTGNALWGCYTGTVNGPALTTDRYGTSNAAYSFDGLNDFIATSYAGILGSNPRAVSFWAKVPNAFTNVTAGNGMYTVSWGSNNTGDRFGCSLDFPADALAIGGAGCNANTGASPGNLTDNAWHHYVFQFPGSPNNTLNDVEMYFDGTLVNITGGSGATNVLNTQNAGGLYNVVFGKTNFSTPNFFEGDLDDVGIWDRMLTVCEIRKLYNCNTCCESSRAAINTPHVSDEGTLTLTNKKSIVLNQNVPNPFAESTEVSYTIPEGFTKAQLLFSDLYGTLIRSVEITQAGKGSLTVFADNLRHGIYSYRLVVDGKTIDTKKMIKE